MPETETKTRKERKTLSEEETARARKLLAEGMTAKVIADNLNVSIGTVYKLKVKPPKTERKAKVNLFVESVQRKLKSFEEKAKYHNEKAQWYQAQLDAVREAITG